MTKFEEFMKERQYLLNVSPATIRSYSLTFNFWLKIEQPTQADITAMIIKMRESGLRAVSVNHYLANIAAYLHWLGSDVRIKKLKEPQRIPQVFSKDDIHKIAAYKPTLDGQHRLQVLLLLLADTGVRISEALGLRWDDIDFDNLLLTVIGKGDKQRTIPFSYELRKMLFKYQKGVSDRSYWVFMTRAGTQVNRHDVLRDTLLLCTRLGIKAPGRAIHAMRHSFATAYIQRGGSVFGLQRCLGHTTITMSQRYCHLNTADLQAIHQRVSLLSR
jgi:integrase/recombinase XerD